MAPIKLILFTLACLLTLSLGSKVQHLTDDADANRVFAILNTMMKEYSLPTSKQIPNCFTEAAKDNLLKALT